MYTSTNKMEIKPRKGYVFKWCNAPARERKGWGIWSPLPRDGELGKDVAKDFESMVSGRFASINADSNYFFRSATSVLAFAKKADAEKVTKARKKAADEQLAMVDKTEGAKVRHTYIPVQPKDV